MGGALVGVIDRMKGSTSTLKSDSSPILDERSNSNDEKTLVQYYRHLR
jgi:hypothetical protein